MLEHYKKEHTTSLPRACFLSVLTPCDPQRWHPARSRILHLTQQNFREANVSTSGRIHRLCRISLGMPRESPLAGITAATPRVTERKWDTGIHNSENNDGTRWMYSKAGSCAQTRLHGVYANMIPTVEHHGWLWPSSTTSNSLAPRRG